MSNPEPSIPESPPSPGGPPRRRLPLGLRLIFFLALAVLVVLATILVALQNSAVGTRLTQVGLRGTTPFPRATMTVREVRGDWVRNLEFLGFRIARGDTVLIAIDTLRVRHDPRGLVGGHVELVHVDLRGVTVSADVIDTTASVPKPDRLSLGDLLHGRFYGGNEIRVRALTLTRGRWIPRVGAPDSVRGFDDVTLALRDGRIGGGRMAFQLERLALRHDDFRLEGEGAIRDGRAELTRFAVRSKASTVTGRGTLTTGDERGAGLTRLEANLDAAPLALTDLKPFLPALDLDGAVTAQVALSGARLDSLDGTLAATTAGARFGAHAVGATRLAARFERGRAEVVAGSAYEGANLDVTGWAWPFDARPTYDLSATADRLPRRIEGIPAYETYARRGDFATTLRVRGQGYAPARLELEGHARGGAGALEFAGTLATGDSLGWSVQRLVFDDLDVARLLGRAEPSAITGTFTGSGDGRMLQGELVVTAATYDTWRLERATAHVRREADGRLRVSDGRFQHLTQPPPAGQPVATTDLSGTFRAEGRGADLTAWFALEPSLLRGERIESAEATVALAGTDLRVDGRAASSAGRIELLAQARPFETPLPYTIERLHFENLDASAFGGSTLPETDLTGTLAGTGEGAGLGSGSLTLGRSRIERFTLDSALGRFDFEDGRMRVDADVHTTGGTASLEVVGDTASYDASGAIPFGVLAHALRRDSLSSDGSLRFTARGQGLAPRTARLDAQVTGEGRIGDARVDSLALDVRLADGIATVDTLLLYSNVAEAHGVGKVALFDTTAVIDSTEGLRFAIVTQDLDPLAPILDLDSLGLAGALVEARLYGSARALAFDATGTVHSLAVDGFRLVGADFAGAGTLDRAYRIDAAEARLHLRNLHGGGIRIQSGQLDVRVADGQPEFELTTELDATHKVALAGTARFDSAMAHVTLTRADVTADSATWALARPARITLSRDRIAIDGFEGRSTQDGLVRAQGVIDRRGRQDFDLELRAVGLDILSAWLGRDDVGGRVDATLALDGPAEAPQAKVDLTLALRVDNQAAGTLASDMVWDGRQVELNGTFAPPTGSPLTLAGHLPLALSLAAPAPGESAQVVRVFSGDVDLRMRGDRVALASFAPFFDPSQVTALGGTLDVDVRLAGHSESLAGSGRFTIAGGRADLPLLGVTYEEANLAAELEGDRIHVREARVRSEKGTLTVSGALRLENLTRIEPDLRVIAANFEAIENKVAHVVATGDLTVTGTLAAPIVRGKASVENSEFHVTQTTAVNTSAERDVQLTPADIHMMEAVFGPVTARRPDLTWLLYDASDLDVEVEIRRNTWVRQRTAPRLAFEMTGTVEVKKRPHEEAELYGRIAPVPGHGYVEQFARRFDFSGGEVLLNGPMNSHSVDIQTTYKTASSGDSGGDDVVVKMDVTGQVDDLKLTLSSEPAMSPTEIVSYIATGQTRSEMATESGSSTTAASLAAQTALSQVTGRVEDLAQESIGLDVVQIRQDAVQGATLVAGRYVSSRLYVGFRQPVQYQANDNTSTSTNYRTQVEVEYEAYQWLLMNLQGESSEINSFIRARRAY